MESSSSAESIKRSFEQDLDECLIRNAAALGFFARAFQQGLWQLDGDRLLALLGGVQGSDHLRLELLVRHGIVRVELVRLRPKLLSDNSLPRFHLPRLPMTSAWTG